jgi:hypothetical protein
MQSLPKWLWPALGLLAICGCGQSKAPGTAESDLHDVHAVVQRFPIDSDTFVLVPEDSSQTRYLPDDLPVEFRQDGLHVVFSARLAPIPANVRLVGTPIELQTMRRQDGRRSS